MAAITPSIDELDRQLADAMPAIDGKDSKLILATYRALARAEARTPAELAADAGIEAELATTRLTVEWPGVFFDDDRRVIGFWGLAIPEVGHRITFDDGAQVHAWCAWDPMFLAPLIGPATVETVDRTTGESISYRIGPGGAEGLHDASRVSFLVPGGTWDADIVGNFCHYVLHFGDEASGSAWTQEHAGTFLLPAADALALGRRHAARLAGGAQGPAAD